ncbi:serine/threonine-protein kinase [Ktedonobacter robiniae]|uniref:Protein kinase domain-containing protein n=1 Tax=Ktedonobacter robiniae TaxID=2778365 RepID=A0ABQ3V7X5_9CHLR|nr:serine/threonine-protein kinase [Ktedonobacter robiniae]GHO61027.1 hypothetical protein KSB_95020 [Ktedonobacter robiniae]
MEGYHMPTAIDAQIGPYRLKRQVGEGGFGKVFLAEHITDHTQVALKLLHTFADDDEEEKEAYAEAAVAFQQEFRVLQSMQHTNIVHVLDGMLDGETPYVAMEYCSYGAFARRYPLGVILPLNLIVSRVRQVASALHYAHQLGVIHRDVKPQNMLFGVNEEILLSDFGLAALTNKGEIDPADPYRFTGTLYYMAPEQFFGQPVPNSDQYALAVTVYNWLSGSFPFPLAGRRKPLPSFGPTKHWLSMTPNATRTR